MDIFHDYTILMEILIWIVKIWEDQAILYLERVGIIENSWTVKASHV